MRRKKEAPPWFQNPENLPQCNGSLHVREGDMSNKRVKRAIGKRQLGAIRDAEVNVPKVARSALQSLMGNVDSESFYPVRRFASPDDPAGSATEVEDFMNCLWYEEVRHMRAVATHESIYQSARASQSQDTRPAYNPPVAKLSTIRSFGIIRRRCIAAD